MKKTKMLKKNYEFKRVLKKGKYYGEKQIEMFVEKSKLPFNLLGIAVSKKVRKSSSEKQDKKAYKRKLPFIRKRYIYWEKYSYIVEEKSEFRRCGFYNYKKRHEKYF